MGKETNKPASATDLRNPLVIFGLVLLGGDLPLVVAYGLTSDPVRAWVLMWATIVFVFSIAAFFCYLVRFKPRHLYAPTEIPEMAIGRSIYRDFEPATLTMALAGITDKKQGEELAPLKSEVLRTIVNNLQEPLCWYLLKVANKILALDQHLDTLAKEIGADVEEFPFDRGSTSLGYFLGLANFVGLLIDSGDFDDHLNFTFEMSPEVLDLIVQRLHPEIATAVS